MDKECGVNRIQPHVAPCSIHRFSTSFCSELKGGRSSGISSCQTDSQRTPPSGSPWINASCLDPFMAEVFFERSKPSFGVERVMAFQAVIGEDRSYFLIKETLFRALNHQGSDGRVGCLASRPVVSCHLPLHGAPEQKALPCDSTSSRLGFRPTHWPGPVARWFSRPSRSLHPEPHD